MPMHHAERDEYSRRTKGLAMRLALKLVMVFMLANMTLAGVYGYLAVRREVALFQQRDKEEAEEMGPIIESLLPELRQTKDDSDIQESLEKLIPAQQQLLRIRWVSFDAKAEPRFRPRRPRRAADLDRHPAAHSRRDR